MDGKRQGVRGGRVQEMKERLLASAFNITNTQMQAHAHPSSIPLQAPSFTTPPPFFLPSFLSPSARGFPKTHVAAMTGKNPSKPPPISLQLSASLPPPTPPSHAKA